MRGIDRRVGLLFCGFLLIFSFAFVRAFWLQGVRGGALRAEAHSQQVTQVTVPGQRGRVLDRNGKVLATTDLVSKLGDRSSGFEYLARKVDAVTASRIAKLDIAGVSTLPTSRRLYP